MRGEVEVVARPSAGGVPMVEQDVVRQIRTPSMKSAASKSFSTVMLAISTKSSPRALKSPAASRSVRRPESSLSASWKSESFPFVRSNPSQSPNPRWVRGHSAHHSASAIHRRKEALVPGSLIVSGEALRSNPRRTVVMSSGYHDTAVRCADPRSMRFGALDRRIQRRKHRNQP